MKIFSILEQKSVQGGVVYNPIEHRFFKGIDKLQKKNRSIETKNTRIEAGR